MENIDNNDIEHHKIKLNEVEKMIPSQHFKTSIQSKKNQQTEWCLKKYIIDGHTFITISIQQPYSDKLIYINTCGNQIIYTPDETYEQYLIEQIYWYGN